MAANSLGVPNSQVLSLKLTCKVKSCIPFCQLYKQAGTGAKAWKHAGVTLPRSSNKALFVCSSQPSLVSKNEAVDSTTEEVGVQSGFSAPVSQLIPNSNEVRFLLTEICDTTSIAEFELKLNGFHLHVTRALTKTTEPLAPSSLPYSSSMSENTAANTPTMNGPVSTSSSLAIYKPGPLEEKSETMLERASDDGLVIIRSPRVGFFRRCRTIKGKRAPPACKEKQVVKEGQVICYIEQLGGEIPVEADASGEVIKILCEDGEPVGYNDAVIAILPSFPGILI